MAQIRVLKIATDGIPLEHSLTDDVTFATFTVNGGGPVLSATGLDMNNQDVVDVSDLAFNDPTTGTINQTAGALVVDNIMAKERSNTLTTAADILFPVISDTAGQVDALRLPALAGAPTATPTAAGEGFVVWDSSANALYVWDGAAWNNQNTVASAENLDDTYVADEAIAARDVVYISAADNVTPALAAGAVTAQAVGLATAAAADTATVTVRKAGRMSGFTGLTAGARYYLDGTTPGAITASVPSGSGHTIIQVGYAKNATVLDIQLQSLGRRA